MATAAQGGSQVTTVSLTRAFCRKAACPKKVGAGGGGKGWRTLIYDKWDESNVGVHKTFHQESYLSYYMPINLMLESWMHFPAEISPHKTFFLLSGVSLQQNIVHNPEQWTSASSLAPHRLFVWVQCFAKFLGKWKVEGGLIDIFRGPRGSGPPERRKGANRY